MSYRNDQSKKSSTALDQASTLLAVVELSRNSWLVAGIVPGIDRHPLKKLGADENGLLALLHRWQQQAVKAGREIKHEMAFGSRVLPRTYRCKLVVAAVENSVTPRADRGDRHATNCGLAQKTRHVRVHGTLC